MHTVGFYHEHSRSDRDMYIEVGTSSILYTMHAIIVITPDTSGLGEETMVVSNKTYRGTYKERLVYPGTCAMSLINRGFYRSSFQEKNHSSD